MCIRDSEDIESEDYNTYLPYIPSEADAYFLSRERGGICLLYTSGSSLSFWGVDMTISSSFISSLGVFSAGGVEVIMPFSST